MRSFCFRLRMHKISQALLRPGVRCRCSTSHGNTEYTTIAEPTRMESEVKRSKFLTTAFSVSSPDEAIKLLEGLSDRAASHNCWAFQAGQHSRCSDDGEPHGTAGRPILEAIRGEGLDYTAVLVTRFFGGIKLGPGGLVRAYGWAARDCLRGASKVSKRSRVSFRVSLPYKQLGSLYQLLPRLGADRLGDEEYHEDGSVGLLIVVDSDKALDFTTQVSDFTSGETVPQIV